MKILHITNEFTKKNFSISKLIVFLSSHIYQKFNFNFSILTSKLEKNLFDDQNIEILNFSKWSDYLFRKFYLTNIFKSYDVIHIHGVWAPIQFASILICNKKKINCFIHPHGMLLKEAIRSAGLLKFFFKVTALLYLKLIINNNVKFISITSQETKAIKKYFPNSFVKEISNPIPFRIEEKKNFSLIPKKNIMVYFGRIHPHKNLQLLINSFISANLSEKWKLEIYGIRDDENYLKQLKKLIENNSQIQIHEPIFDEEKQEVMSTSWINLLISKSEVLSLSILESSVHELPSLVNSEIETEGFKDKIISSNLSQEDLKNKFIEISKWSTNKRNEIGKEISKKVKLKTSLDNILEKYQDIYKSLKNQNKQLDSISSVFKKHFLLNFISQNKNFLINSSTYTFNLMLSSFLVIVLVFFGKYSLAGELGLVISFWITITQIFSSNMRAIIISEENINYAIHTYFYRIIFSIIVLTVFLIFGYNIISIEYKDLIFIISLMILSQWINEMNLVQYELKKQNFVFRFLLATNLITVVLAFIFIFKNNIDFLKYIFILYIFIIFLTSLKNYYYLFANKFRASFLEVAKINFRSIAFLSSFSIIFSSLAWRIMIFYLFNKSLAGVFFACFSIGSFPGTLFNSVIGPSFIKERITIPIQIKYFFYLTFLIIFIYAIFNFTKIPFENFLVFDFFVFTTSLSLVGSFFMVYAMYRRHIKIQQSIEDRKYLFKMDILYGASITFLIPLLFYFGGATSVSFAYLITSIIAFIFYSSKSKFKILS